MGQADPRSVDLVGRFTTHLLENLDALGYAGSAGGMPFGFQTAAWIDRDATTDVGLAVLDHLGCAELLAEAEVLVVDQFDASEAVVHLGDIDLNRADTRHRIGRLGCLHRGWERRHVWLVLVHHAVDPESDTTHPHRLVGVLVSDVFGDEDHRCSTVTLRSAVVEAERVDDHRSVEDLLDRDLEPHLCFRVGDAVLVVLDGNHSHVLAGGSRRLVQIAGGVEGKVRWSDEAKREVPGAVAGHPHPVPERRTGGGLADLVGTDYEHHVEHAAGDCHHAVPNGVVAGGAGVFEP